MKNFTKVLVIISLTLILIVCALYILNSSRDENIFEYEKIDIATLSGPTGFGLAYLFDNKDYNVTVYDAPDQISAGLIKGEIMFATIPTNMAAILNNKTNGKIKILSVIAEGNLYVLTTRDDINDIEDLRDKTITLSGKGATPEVIATDIFKNYNVNFDYKSEHAEVVALMKANKADIIMIPEPFVTIAKKQIEGVKVALSIDELWNEKYNNLGLPMGSLVMNTDFLIEEDDTNDKNDNHFDMDLEYTNNKENKDNEQEKLDNDEDKNINLNIKFNVDVDVNINNKDTKEERVEKLLKDVAHSIKNVNKNIKESSKLIEEKEIINVKDIAIDAIENCNIVFINTSDAKDMLDNYFDIIYKSNSKLTGGKVINEKIYYQVD